MGTKQEKRISYVFYKDWSEVISTMPPEMELQVRRAIDAYVFNDEQPELPEAARYFFEALKKDIDRDREKFTQKCERNRENIRKRYERIRSNTVEYDRIRSNTNATENENENEDGNEKEIQGDKHPMSIDKKTSLSKESEVKKAQQSSAAPAPTLEMVQEYITSRGNKIDAQQFFDFYEANGWVQNGGKKIRDWKAAARTWERNGLGITGEKAAGSTKKGGKAQEAGYSSREAEQTRDLIQRIDEGRKNAITHTEWLRIQKERGIK